MKRRILLSSGLLASLLYVGIDIVGALSFPGYDYAAQVISEMSAVGAPTRTLLSPLYVAFTLLFFPFGIGVWLSAGIDRRLRMTAVCLLAVGLLGFAWPFFPMHARGAERTFTDTMHLVLGGLDMLLLAGAIGFAARASGRAFRFYSIATILVMLVFGGVTAFYAPRLDAGLPTPWMGVAERIAIGAYLLWIAVLSIVLIRSPGPGAEPRYAAAGDRRRNGEARGGGEEPGDVAVA